MDKQLLDILVCPVTGAAVTLADAQLIERINARIGEGGLQYADGSPVTESLASALVTADRTTLYRIDDDIPVMLPERSIELPPANA